MVCPDSTLSNSIEPSAGGEVVVVVHGLGANGLVMSLLARRIARAGYGTVVWSYPSFRGTIERHGGHLHERLSQLDANPDVARIHLVTHSMGGIVARCALGQGRPAKLGRFVMLAPPNLGSPLAAFWGPKLRWCVPAIDQLAKRRDSFVSCLPMPEGMEIGVIAASMDLLVGSGNTFMPCQRDSIVLCSTHTLLVFRRSAAREVVQFLATGRFSPTALRPTLGASKVAGTLRVP